ncbi:MAG: permease [Bacteroidota bacterium]
MRRKVPDREKMAGIKALILSVALPATIFIALLKIELTASLLTLPLLALLLNGVLFGSTWFAMPCFGVSQHSNEGRTLLMLIPSLAPGISCFPFVIEYMNDEALAWAALTDLGNKIFVLILLYILALYWYQQLYRATTRQTGKGRALIKAMVQEPVNLVLFAGVLLILFGFNLGSLPLFIQDTLLRLSNMMTPMVLLFIGIAVLIRAGDLRLILTALSWKAGVALKASALLLFLFPTAPHALLIVIFPLSACSFWPYAHMCAINKLSSEDEQTQVFDLNLALSTLALSLPLSTVLILLACTFETFFVDPLNAFGVGTVFMAIAWAPSFWQRLRRFTAFRVMQTDTRVTGAISKSQ